MLNSKLARVGASVAKHLCTRNCTSLCGIGYVRTGRYRDLQSPLEEGANKFVVSRGWEKLDPILPMSYSISDNGHYEDEDNITLHNFLSTMTTNNTTEEGSEEKETISVTFIDKDGEENHIKVPVGMSMLEAAHENDIELEGKSFKAISEVAKRIRLACVFNLPCYSHGTSWDVEHYNKLEDPTDEENDMLDLAFGLTETWKICRSRLGCQVIAKPELDGIRLAVPAATRNFAVDGFVPKPH
ncbi:hypothetical protein V8G54_017228 [Vigna mungo]|uniref:2Fe-2S ferredoxin-type domain-containing protein n=1 Tax=Vigna mungo TaxID=3915 RepID=A0AAQ3NQK4_VIGMU